MSEYVLYIIAFMVTFPFLITVVLYFAFTYLYQNKVKALHQSVNWTTLLYVLFVNRALSLLFHQSFTAYIIVFLLSILTVIVIVQWKKQTDVDLFKAIKLLWRISFLLFFLLYFGLVLYGIVAAILS